MLEVRKIIDECRATSVEDLFARALGRYPYFLNYSLSDAHPDLFLIYPSRKSDRSRLAVRECNGLVVRKADLQIVSMGQMLMSERDYSAEFARSEKETRQYLPDRHTEIQLSVDCPVVRTFFYDGEWIVTTNRRLNAKESKWFSEDESFYDYFEQCVFCNCTNVEKRFENLQDILNEYLDKTTTYTFGIMHPNAHHVVRYPRPGLVLLGQRCMQGPDACKEIDLYDKILASELPNAPFYVFPEYVVGRHNAQNNELMEQMRCMVRGFVSVKHRGDEEHVERYKCDHPMFHVYDVLRGNHPTFQDSYICADRVGKVLLRSEFAMYSSLFDAIDRALLETADRMYAERDRRQQHQELTGDEVREAVFDARGVEKGVLCSLVSAVFEQTGGHGDPKVDVDGSPFFGPS